MRHFAHLLRRELRDVRWYVRGGLVLSAVLVVGAYAWMDSAADGQDFDPQGVAARVWIALAAILGGGAVAAECVAGDASSRRVEGAALLPVRLGDVFAAKAAAVALATVLFAAWAAAWAPFAAWLCAGPSTTLGAVDALGQGPFLLCAAAPVVALVVLFAVLLEHGLGSIVLGVGTSMAGTFALGISVPWHDWGLDWSTHRATGAVALVVTAAVVGAAAAAAFVRGPIHLARRFRRVAVAAGVVVVVLGPAGGAAGAAFEARTEIEPGDPAVQVAAICPSPDGRRAVVIVGAGRVPWICRAWLVDLGTGAVVVLPGKHRSFHRWGTDGTFRLWDGRDANRADTVDTFDGATGAWLRTRSRDQLDAEPWTEGWARFARTTDGMLVEWPERGVRRQIEGAYFVSASPRPGVLLAGITGKPDRLVDLGAGTERELGDVAVGTHRWVDGGRRLRFWSSGGQRDVDVDTGADRAAGPPSGTWATFGEGPYATYHPDRRHVGVVDTRDGRVVGGPWPLRAVSFVTGSERHAIVYQGLEPTRLLDCATGAEVVLEPNPNSYGYPPSLIAALPGDRFLLARPGAGLDVIGADGRVVRMVLAGAR